MDLAAFYKIIKSREEEFKSSESVEVAHWGAQAHWYTEQLQPLYPNNFWKAGPATDILRPIVRVIWEGSRAINLEPDLVWKVKYCIP